MPLMDVRRVYVVQDRDSGSFVDVNMTWVTSLRAAVRVDDKDRCYECMRNSIEDGIIECRDGYDVIELLEPVR